MYSIQVEIEGVAKAGYLGDVAIDDIEWNPRCQAKKLCHEDQYSCRDPKCIPSFLECNFYDDCASGSDEHHCGKFLNKSKSLIINLMLSTRLSAFPRCSVH